MASYRLSPLAEIDLEEIWLYTSEKWSLVQADRYYADIIDTIELLSAGKRRGHKVEARDGYQKYPVGSHHVYFRNSECGIDVIRILHQRMNTNLHL